MNMMVAPTVKTFRYDFYQGTSLLKSVQDENFQPYAEIFLYSPQGKIESLSYNSQTVLVNYEYSGKTGRLTGINSYRVSDSVGISEKTYEYSDAGDITLISDIVKGVDNSYLYDHAHRLISEMSTGGAAATTVEVIEFTYGEEETNPDMYPVHAPSKIATSTTTGGSTTTSTTNYTYSAAGNRTSQITGINVTTYTSNDDNMIMSIDVDGVVTQFTYDADGQRVKKAQGAATTLYYGPEFEIISGASTFYLFAGNLRIGMIQNGATQFFVKDHLGSTNAIVESDGTIIDTGEYMPYGQDGSGNDLLQSTSYKFTDQEQDVGTGLYNYDARLYDPVIGQFIMAEPLCRICSTPRV